MSYTPKVGDRVRVTYEGAVRSVAENAFVLEGGRYFRMAQTVSVEKIEPPVEVFNSGDVVRFKPNGHIYAIGRDGYLNLTTGYTSHNAGYFTSKDYEKVNLG